MAHPCQAGALPLSHTQKSSVQFKAHQKQSGLARCCPTEHSVSKEMYNLLRRIWWQWEMWPVWPRLLKQGLQVGIELTYHNSPASASQAPLFNLNLNDT